MKPKRVGIGVAVGLLFVLGAVAACSGDDPAAKVGEAAAAVPPAATPTVTIASPSFVLAFERDVSIRYGGRGTPLTLRTLSADASTHANVGKWQAHARLDIAPLLTNDTNCHTRPLHVAAWGAAAVTEVWCDRESVLEHAYQFTERPKTHELVIEVEVHGVRRGVQLADRVRLDTRAGIAMNYGKAAWLDANGVRHPVQLGWQADVNGDGGKLLLRVSSDALDKTAYPAVLDPELDPWTAVAEPVYVPSGETSPFGVRSAAPLGNDIALFFRSDWVRLRSDGSVTPLSMSPLSPNIGWWRARGAPFGAYYARPGHLFRLSTSGVWLIPETMFPTIGNAPHSVHRRSDGDLAVLTRSGAVVDRTIFSTDGTVLQQDIVPAASWVIDLDNLTVRRFATASGMLDVEDVEVATGVVLRSASVTAPSGIRNVVSLPAARSVVLASDGIRQFDATLTPLYMDFLSVANVYAVFGIAVAGDVACVAARTSDGAALIQVSLSANQVIATHPTTANIGDGAAPSLSHYANGFVLAEGDQATLLDGSCVPVTENISLRTVPQTQHFAGIARSSTDAWALWRDGRGVDEALYARQLDPTTGSPTGTDTQGTLVLELPGGTHVASVTNGDRSVVTVHQAVGGDVSTLAFDGGPLPTPQAFGQAAWTNIVPLLDAGGDVRLVGRRLTACPSPPCESELMFGDGSNPPVVLASGARDYTEVVSASRGADHWVLARAELDNGATQVRVLSVDFATGAAAVDVLLTETSTAAVQLAGIAIDDAGIPAAVWSESQFAGSSTYYFATVNQGAAVPGGQGPWPGGAHLTSLDQQRGYVAGGLLLDRDGNTVFEIVTPDVQQGVAAMTAEPGHVILGVNERDSAAALYGESSLIHTAHLFVGEADGNACASDSECGSGFCQEGACCERKCGLCERCDGGTPGKCVPAVSTDDDSCFGDRSCDDAGACKPADGETCVVDTDCASGFCVDGVCCDSACDDACGACLPGVGVCTLVECGAYACAGGGECKQICESTVDCAPEFVCGADERCVTPDADVAVDEGCGCRVVRPEAPSRVPKSAAWMLALGLALAARRRRLRVA